MSKRFFITEDSVPYVSQNNYIFCKRCEKKYILEGFMRVKGSGEGWKQITNKDVDYVCNKCDIMNGGYSPFVGRFVLKKYAGNSEFSALGIYEVPEELTITFDDIINKKDQEDLPTDRNIFRDFISGRKSGRKYSSGF
ncbi:MAG: hypothetical protein KAS32_19820 [Candidatus Peribacteraceae bacterium]|nr:hypothetical protein [Candidatus Peribacteraceae bacterium]